MLTLARSSSKDALILGERRVTYDEFVERSWNAGKALQKLVTSQVAIFSENSLEWAVAAYGIWSAERVLVPIDAHSTAEDVAYILGDCLCGALYVSEELRKTAEQAIRLLEKENKAPPELIPLSPLLLPGEGPVKRAPIEQENEERLAVIIYTSGTTGDPKGVMLSYANLHENLKAVTAFGYFKEDERVLVILPLHHVLPLMGCIMAPLATGGTAIFSPSLARDDVVRTLNEHRITMLVGVPRFYELLGGAIRSRIESSWIASRLFEFARKRGSSALSARLFRKVHQGFGGHLRYMVCGGAALDPQIAELFLTLGFRLVEGYGMTECAPLISFPDPNWIKAGYCGRPVKGTQVEIHEGEIFVKGPQVMLGYFGREEETLDVLKDGWLTTGDLGEFDSDSFLKITGRRKEILVLPSGKNVNPALSEELLLEECNELEEAAVFLDREVLHALVVPQGGVASEEDLESYFWTRAAARHNERVAPYRQLSRITVCKEELPRTRLGKLRRHQLPHLAERLRAENGAQTLAQEASSEVEERLITYLKRTGTSSVSPRSRLGADLGLDSLGKLELLEFIRKNLGSKLPEDRLTDRLRISELAAAIENGETSSFSNTAVSWSEILSSPSDSPLPNTSWIHRVLLLMFRLLLRSLWSLEVKGRENLPDGPFILAPNHQSAIDGAVLTAALSLKEAQNTFFLGKEAHLSTPMVEALAKRCRIVPVNQRSSVGESLRAVAHVLRLGFKIVVFPEGTRTRTGKLGDFKESYAIVAKEMSISVVPVVIEGAFDILPRARRVPRLFRKVRITFLPPASPPHDSVNALNERVHHVIERTLAP